MTTTKLTIEDFEDKKAASGRRYTRFKTSQGWMSAFDKKLIETLKDKEGKLVKVKVAIDEEKGFKNLRGYVGECEEDEEEDEEERKKQEEEKYYA